MERRHLVVGWQAWRIDCAGVVAGFKHDDTHAGFGQPSSERAATGAGTDDDIVAVGVRRHAARDQNVFRNSISARLSSSLRPEPSGAILVPK